jgi:hypothetical protein
VLARNRKTVEQWRAISLSPDVVLASSRYRSFLQDLCNRHQLTIRQIPDGNAQKVSGGRTAALVTPLTYDVHVEGTLVSYLGFLYDFYSLNLPHLIRTVTIIPQGGGGGDGRLEIHMKIEALSMPSATTRDHLIAVPETPLVGLDVLAALKGVPVGLGVGPWLFSGHGPHGARKLAATKNEARDYAKLISKNAFAGLVSPVPPEGRGDREILRFVQLTGITTNFIATEATLRNRILNKTIRLRAEGGHDEFEIRDGNDQVVLKGKVKAINHGTLVFETGEKHYQVHMGQFFSQAMQKELSRDELKSLGLAAKESIESP